MSLTYSPGTNTRMHETPEPGGRADAARANPTGDFAHALHLSLIRDNCQKGTIALCQPDGCARIGGLDFLSIRLVVLCEELGCLSGAAKHCNMSLSTASHRLTNVERVFGRRLFKRDHRGLHSTAAGDLFLVHARPILQTMYWAERQLKALPLTRA